MVRRIGLLDRREQRIGSVGGMSRRDGGCWGGEEWKDRKECWVGMRGEKRGEAWVDLQ